MEPGLASPITPVRINTRHNNHQEMVSDEPASPSPAFLLRPHDPLDPTSASSTATPPSSSSPSDPCSICFVSLRALPVHQLPCGHTFHKSCIRAHAEHSGTFAPSMPSARPIPAHATTMCPYCRTEFPCDSSPFVDLKLVPRAPIADSQYYQRQQSDQILNRMAAARQAVARRMQQQLLNQRLVAAAES